MSSKPVSPTNSESSSSSPSKLRSSRLNERIQRTKKHRQWMISNSSVASGSTGSETASSQQERARLKMTKHAENHNRQKKSPRSPHANDFSTSHPTPPPQKLPVGTYPASQIDRSSDGNSLQEDVAAASSHATAGSRSSGRNSANDTRAVVVAWPDAETDDDEYPVTAPNPLVYKPQPPAPSSSSSSQPPKSWNATPHSNLGPKSSYPSPIDQARARFETTTSESTISPTSISSEPVKPSWQRGSVTKRYAPWEKRNDNAPTTATPEQTKSASHNSVTPQTTTWQTATTPQRSEPSDMVENDNVSTSGSVVSAKRSAAWNRSDARSPTPSWSGAKNQYPKVVSASPSWQTPNNHRTEAGMDAESDVWSAVSSSVPTRPAGGMRPDAKSQGPATTGKLAPWQKPKSSDLNENPPISSSSSVGSVVRSWQQRVDAKSPVPPKVTTAKLAPWQKPQNDEDDDAKSQATDLMQSPSYDIGRQGSWQKPKSPARPSTPSQPDLVSSGRETPVQLWKRREQELKAATAVKSEPNKLAPRQVDLQPRNSTNDMPDSTQSKMLTSPSYGRASPIPRVGSVQSPPWVKPTSTGPQVLPNRQEQLNQPTWVKKQSQHAEVEAPMTPKTTIDSRPPAHDYLHTPVPSDVASSHGMSEFTPTIGGAVIETPKVQSVASLRASLGAKPAPPPLPGLVPPAAIRSPGDSPWLAGNRKAANRVGSPFLGGKDETIPPSLPRLSTDQAMPDDPIDNKQILSSRSASTPTRTAFSRVGKTETGETESESTPVTSHVNPNGRANIQPRSLVSPVKSLADMAADSVMITDYSQLKARRSDEGSDDEESMISSGIGTIAPSRGELPSEFRDIVPQRSFERKTQYSVQESTSLTLLKERSPISLVANSEESVRRKDLRSRIENYGKHEDDEDSSPARVLKSMPFPSDEKRLRDSRIRPTSPVRRYSPEVSSDVLDRIRTMGFETEGSDTGGSSAAVFGDPGTWGAAGGDLEVQAPPVADRVRAISAWNGGVTKRDQNGLEELNSILGDEVPTQKVDTKFNDENGNFSPKARDYGKSQNLWTETGNSKKSVSPSPSAHSARGASRILKFFETRSQDELTGDEESVWASRDPDIDVVAMRDESPSPEPYDSSAHFEQYKPEKSPHSSRHQGHKVHFEPDPNDPFYADTHSQVQDNQLESLDPDHVFGTFWATEGANETFDFDEVGSSFFSSTSDDKAVLESPFRVVLKPPRPPPANRGRRQREAANDYDSRFSSPHSPSMDSWNEFSVGRLEL